MTNNQNIRYSSQPPAGPPQGQPDYGQPGHGQPVQGQPVQGQPVQGHPVQGQPVQGQPGQAQPGYAQPARGLPNHGQLSPSNGEQGPAAGKPARRRGLGLPFLALVGLAVLGVPRVILHDLGLIEAQTFVNAMLVFVPAAIWILTVVLARVPNPFLTVLTIGGIYGVLLMLTHQLLWGVAFGDDPPQLGGNLAGMDPAAQEVIMRGFAVGSSLFTGVMVGVVAGLVAWGISALVRSSSRSR